MYKNYKLIKEQQLKDINSEGILLTHEKSNAKVLLLKNDDENKSFCIGFRTPPYDDTGLPHILEHSVLCGSRKFPVKEPFVELMKSSLNTFLNAMTYPDKTIYPVASCNEQDFRNLMDIYMDAVLYPNIHTKEEIFKQEGWHYELDSTDGEITYNGVVYNEMKGAFSSSDEILARESFNSLFPDTSYGVESGGNPDFIPTLTYEKFKEFHKKYYHPSNSYIIIYGNCDMEETLSWLDKEYLSNFEKIDIDSSLKEQVAFKELKEKTVYYPINEEQGVDNKTLMSYNIALPAYINQTDLFAIDIISQVLLKAAGAPLERALLDEGIGDVVEGSFEASILQPMFTVTVKNTNDTEKEHFINVIEKELKEYIKNGLDKKALLASINSLEFKLREADFGGMSKGIIYTINAFNTWLYNDNDPFSSFDYSDIFNTLKEKLETKYFEELIEKYLINNNHKAIVIAKPSTTYQNEKEEALKNKLAAYKNSLSDDEIEKLVNDTKALKAYQASPDTEEDLKTIPLLKKEDLSYDILSINNNVEYIEGVKVLHHDYSTNGIAYIRLLFNIKNIPAELIPYLGIYNVLFKSLDTKNHSYQSLDQDIDVNTGGISANIHTLALNNDFDVYYLVRINALYNNINYALDLLKEIITSTNFDMKDRIKECLAMAYSSMQQVLVGAGHAKSLIRALSYFNVGNYLEDSVSGINYFDVLTTTLKEYDNKYDELVQNLKKLNEFIFNKDNLLVSFTGSAEGYLELKNNLKLFVNNLNEKQINTTPFKFEKHQLNEGLKAPYDVQYVALAGNFIDEGYEYTGALQVLKNAVGTDFLWKNVRVLGGAYGCMCGFGRNGASYFVSYRDPNLKKTLDVYHDVVNYLEDFNPNDEEMLKYIIGAVGKYDYPKSPASKGLYALNSYLQGHKEEDYLKEKREIIDATKEDIKALIPYVKSIIKQNNICVIGNIQKIEEAKEIFKETKMLLK